MGEKILLGKLKANAGTYADGENLWLEKHSWDCGWYWGFGYVGNKNSHFHFDSLMEGTKYQASDIFAQTNINDNDWWVIRSLFKQAYALRSAAEVYKNGGNQTFLAGTTDVIKNEEMATRLNRDLEVVLDKLWDVVQYSAHFKLTA